MGGGVVILKIEYYVRLGYLRTMVADAHQALQDGCAHPAQRRRPSEDASPAPPASGREGRRWRVHTAVAGGAAAALVALSCTVALGAPFSARPRQHGTQLLQWFGLAQGTLNEGRAPDAGNVMARTLGVREGTIPKVILTNVQLCFVGCEQANVQTRSGTRTQPHAHPNRLPTHTHPAQSPPTPPPPPKHRARS